MEQTDTYSLRPVREDDEALLFEIYSSTRAAEMALVPWDAAAKETFLQSQFTAQKTHYLKFYPEATHDLILVEGQPAGRLYVNRRADEIHVLDIALLPEFRSLGIGTTIIQNLMAEAASTNRSVLLHVEIFNPAMKLYERLGFVKASEQGIYHEMIWKSNSLQAERSNMDDGEKSR
jgi:ribosomal protein S18 acetylase RimI-like enzyme